KRIVSGSGNKAAGFSERGEAHVWDAESGDLIASFEGHSGTVSSVCFSPDGQRIVSGGSDRMVKLWDAQTGQEAITLSGHTPSFTSVCFSADGRLIVSGGLGRAVLVWDARNGRLPTR